MARLDARKELWTEMEVRGVSGWFNDMRIDRSTIPPEYNFYELADGDCDGIPCRYQPSILVNFYGTFITKKTLPMEPDDGGFTGYINDENDYGFLGGPYSLEFIQVLDRFDENFNSRAHGFVYVLNNTDGKNRSELLGITEELYTDRHAAVRWRNDIWGFLDETSVCTCDIPEEDIATAKGVLSKLYANMVDGLRDEDDEEK